MILVRNKDPRLEQDNMCGNPGTNQGEGEGFAGRARASPSARRPMRRASLGQAIRAAGSECRFARLPPPSPSLPFRLTSACCKCCCFYVFCCVRERRFLGESRAWGWGGNVVRSQRHGTRDARALPRLFSRDHCCCLRSPRRRAAVRHRERVHRAAGGEAYRLVAQGLHAGGRPYVRLRAQACHGASNVTRGCPAFPCSVTRDTLLPF